MSMSLSLHGANRMLERDVPLEALEGVRVFVGKLKESEPFRFFYRGVTIVATLAAGRPKLISAWFSDIPVDAKQGVKIAAPLLSEGKPFRFYYNGLTITAMLNDGGPTVISAWFGR